MNRQEKDILRIIATKEINNQRMLADLSGHSLGIVNRSVKALKEEKYINEDFSLTKKAIKKLENYKSKKAIILAAGFGLRMVPINKDVPKALLEVKKEILIERLIKQLKEKGINEIYVVVGYEREKFDYLIDKYGVKLIVNTKYFEKNNLYSLFLARNYIGDTYILPCDLYFEENPFNSYELYSWYMVDEKKSNYDFVEVNTKMEIFKDDKLQEGNKSLGIAYIRKEEKDFLIENLEKLSKNNMYDSFFWEEALYTKNKMNIIARVMKNKKIYEINTFEDLVKIDENSIHLKTDVIKTIENVFESSVRDIKNVSILKDGMTNISFYFEIKNNKYVIKIPRPDSENLLYLDTRDEEKEIYEFLKGRGVSENIIYMDPDNGYRISKYIENSHSCDTKNIEDVKKSIKFLKHFHDLKIKIGLEFSLFDRIEFYEKLWNRNSAYPDYLKTKENIFSLKSFIDENTKEKTLAHLDAVPNNFLISDKEVRLIDWEDARFADPHIDIAMFCIFAMYDKEDIDKVIDIYFESKCENSIRKKIYAYIAVSGLLWSNWCEYKRNLGVEFGEYAMKQYRYAKDFYKIIENEIN